MIRAIHSKEDSPSLVISKAHNKAHTAAGNRIARRFQADFTPDGQFDIQVDDLKVEVETSASLSGALIRLETVPGRVYIAVTNKDGVLDALAMSTGRVGVMDAHGNVVRECNAAG